MRRVGIAIVLAIAVLFALDRAFPPDMARLDIVGNAVRDSSGRMLALRPATGGVWKFRTGADQIPRVLTDLLVATEDRHFNAHPGVDPLAVLRALWLDMRAGHIVSGGSTITMQVARLLSPHRRSFAAKMVEALRALQLTERYDKRAILGMWLSLAPFGGNLVGLEAASRAYFGKPPSALEPAEAALLVALPRRPEALRPDRHPDAARALRDRILAQAASDGVLTQAEMRAAIAEPVPHHRLPMPDTARLLVADAHDDVSTTLDAGLQTALDRLAHDELDRLSARTSLAVVIADLKSRAVLAAFAGDARNPDRAGWLDLTRRIRSPGSALKPFLYALAFEDGIAGPDTILPDGPRRFAGYAPEDFARRFAGNVTAADALRRSLNLPAIELLSRYGPARFAAALHGAGLVLSRGAAASLPIVVGGAGITLRNLTALYAALGTDGRLMPLRLQPRHREARSAVAIQANSRGCAWIATPSCAGLAMTTHDTPLLSPAAAQSVAAILTRPFPDGGPGGIAWKTGTSAGNRDSWALGFDAAHVVGVWIGRPDGSARPGLPAADVALPVLARVFALLPPHPRAAAEPARTLSLAATPPLDRLTLLSPPPAATFAGLGPVPLRAQGGERPLTFLVNGSVVPSLPALRQAQWLPNGPGFYDIAVLDNAGHSARARVRVVRDDDAGGG